MFHFGYITAFIELLKRLKCLLINLWWRLTEYNVVFAETNEKLTEEMKKLKLDCLEKQQQLEEASSRLKLYSRVSWQLRIIPKTRWGLSPAAELWLINDDYGNLSVLANREPVITIKPLVIR